MSITTKLIGALEELRKTNTIKVNCIKISLKANEEIFSETRGKNYKMNYNDSGRIVSFSDIDVFLDPYPTHVWIQIYYSTPVESMLSKTIEVW